jgi:hypothetical protein
MGRQGVAGEACPVEQQDPQTSPGREHGSRRPSHAGPANHDVVRARHWGSRVSSPDATLCQAAVSVT